MVNWNMDDIDVPSSFENIHKLKKDIYINITNFMLNKVNCHLDLC
jgi:uncharacterized protein YdaT